MQQLSNEMFFLMIFRPSAEWNSIDAFHLLDFIYENRNTGSGPRLCFDNKTQWNQNNIPSARFLSLSLVSTDGGKKIITQQATVKECRTQEPRQHAEDERWHIEWLSVDNFQINGIKFRVEIYFASFLMEKQKSTAKKMRLNSKWKQDAWEQFCGKFEKKWTL